MKESSDTEMGRHGDTEKNRDGEKILFTASPVHRVSASSISGLIPGCPDIHYLVT